MLVSSSSSLRGLVGRFFREPLDAASSHRFFLLRDLVD